MNRTNISTDKKRISITIQPTVHLFLNHTCKMGKLTKSEVIELALNIYFKRQLMREAKALSKMKFDDLPTEDEWLLLDAEIDEYRL